MQTDLNVLNKNK